MTEEKQWTLVIKRVRSKDSLSDVSSDNMDSDNNHSAQSSHSGREPDTNIVNMNSSNDHETRVKRSSNYGTHNNSTNHNHNSNININSNNGDKQNKNINYKTSRNKYTPYNRQSFADDQSLSDEKVISDERRTIDNHNVGINQNHYNYNQDSNLPHRKIGRQYDEVNNKNYSNVKRYQDKGKRRPPYNERSTESIKPTKPIMADRSQKYTNTPDELIHSNGPILNKEELL